MSNAGLPGTSGFVGEFFVIIALLSLIYGLEFWLQLHLFLEPLTPFGCIRELCLGNSMHSLIKPKDKRCLFL